MKKSLLTALALCCCLLAGAQQWKVITIVESIVPAGIGRSRIVETQHDADVDKLTTQRTGDKSNAGEVSRSEIKEAAKDLKETKLLNFYSLTGINFGNIAANDAVIAAKMEEQVQAGWKVAYITSGVESDAGAGDGTGIFITRIFFTRD
jgi:hypothetical protein